MIKNTFLSMIRPGYAEEDSETTEGTTQSSKQTNQTTTETHRKKLSLDENYPGINYNLLNSSIFTHETQQSVFAEPTNIEDAQSVVEALKAGKMIILFLDDAEESQQSRILDFINGYAYAYNIQPKQLKTQTQWIIDPLNKSSKTNFM